MRSTPFSPSSLTLSWPSPAGTRDGKTRAVARAVDVILKRPCAEDARRILLVCALFASRSSMHVRLDGSVLFLAPKVPGGEGVAWPEANLVVVKGHPDP